MEIFKKTLLVYLSERDTLGPGPLQDRHREVYSIHGLATDEHQGNIQKNKKHPTNLKRKNKKRRNIQTNQQKKNILKKEKRKIKRNVSNDT